MRYLCVFVLAAFAALSAHTSGLAAASTPVECGKEWISIHKIDGDLATIRKKDVVAIDVQKAREGKWEGKISIKFPSRGKGVAVNWYYFHPNYYNDIVDCIKKN